MKKLITFDKFIKEGADVTYKSEIKAKNANSTLNQFAKDITNILQKNGFEVITKNTNEQNFSKLANDAINTIKQNPETGKLKAFGIMLIDENNLATSITVYAPKHVSKIFKEWSNKTWETVKSESNEANMEEDGFYKLSIHVF